MNPLKPFSQYMRLHHSNNLPMLKLVSRSQTVRLNCNHVRDCSVQRATRSRTLEMAAAYRLTIVHSS